MLLLQYSHTLFFFFLLFCCFSFFFSITKRHYQPTNTTRVKESSIKTSFLVCFLFFFCCFSLKFFLLKWSIRQVCEFEFWLFQCSPLSGTVSHSSSLTHLNRFSFHLFLFAHTLFFFFLLFCCFSFFFSITKRHYQPTNTTRVKESSIKTSFLVCFLFFFCCFSLKFFLLKWSIRQVCEFEFWLFQ